MATFKKPESIIATAGWCPGCGHGIVQRLIAESIEELACRTVCLLLWILPVRSGARTLWTMSSLRDPMAAALLWPPA